jgi:hypothetical protein
MTNSNPTGRYHCPNTTIGARCSQLQTLKLFKEPPKPAKTGNVFGCAYSIKDLKNGFKMLTVEQKPMLVAAEFSGATIINQVLKYYS